MNFSQLHLLLADDDEEDCLMFQEALQEITVTAKFTKVYDGEKLVQWLTQTPDNLPDFLFLDLNMPRKNGHECLEEIKKSPQLQSLFVIIFSTTVDTLNIDKLYEAGANYYIQKPNSFTKLIRIIEQILNLSEEERRIQPLKENFILSFNG